MGMAYIRSGVVIVIIVFFFFFSCVFNRILEVRNKCTHTASKGKFRLSVQPASPSKVKAHLQRSKLTFEG